MHAVIRRSARSARSLPAAFIGGRRYPSARFFHRTLPIADDAGKPPIDPSQDDSRGRNEQNINGTGQTTGGADTAASAETAPEAEEALNEKLQASREIVRRYSAQLRKVRKKSDGFPPIIIPDWFLERNVKLAVPASTEGESSTGRHGATARLVNSRTGGEIARFEIPLYREHYSKIAKLDADTRRDPPNQAHQSPIVKHYGIVRTFRGCLDPPEGILDPTADPLTAPLPEEKVDRRVFFEVLLSVEAGLSTARQELRNSFPSAKSNLTLHCPVDGGIESLDKLMDEVQGAVGADIVRLDAQDLAQVLGDYLGTEPSAHSLRSLSYETHGIRTNPFEVEDDEYEDMYGEEEEEEDRKGKQGFGQKNPSNRSARVVPVIAGVQTISLANLPDFLSGKLKRPSGERSGSMADSAGTGRSLQRDPGQWEELKLANALEAIIDAINTKRSTRTAEPKHEIAKPTKNPVSETVSKWWHGQSAADNPVTRPKMPESIYMGNIMPNIQLHVERPKGTESDESAPAKKPRRTIVVVKDYKELSMTKTGARILDKLQKIVHDRRVEGSQIMIVGMTASADLVPDLTRSAVRGLQAEDEESFSRTIVVPPATRNRGSHSSWFPKGPDPADEYYGRWESAERKRNHEINLRHIQDMVGQLDPTAKDIAIPGQPLTLPFEPPSSISLRNKILPFHEIHRIGLAAVGYQKLMDSSSPLKPIHIIVAMWNLRLSDDVKFAWITREREERNEKAKQNEAVSELVESKASKARKETEVRLERAQKSATKHEKKLLNGVINPQNINTTFADVHAAKETVDALKSMTSLSLLRPEAFKYGVLATDKIPGLLLYGPPGTGKTLLAKAVAKESGATVLDVSGSEIYDKYVGEGEKNVRAIFTLARKLSPCVVFIDEADAIFGSRSGPGNRTSHREIINQFLKEWDGMNDLSVFIMVATNRPFDLDDAVLRRLPRRLLVDLPVEKDREQILRIHLKLEQLADDVSITDLASRTPFYSGSDLKNLCVAAALACVREENEAAAKALAEADPDSRKSMTDLYPEKRTLRKDHFEKAMQEISASISEDMGSLKAIRQFDEQYGDRRNRKKKKGWGFALADDAPKESAARVRS